MAEEKDGTWASIGCLAVLAIPTAFIVAALNYFHFLIGFGYGLPAIAADVYAYRNAYPIKAYDCKGNLWTDEFHCTFRSDSTYVSKMHYYAYQISRTGIVKVDEGSVDAPMLGQGQPTKGHFKFHRVRDVDSILIIGNHSE